MEETNTIKLADTIKPADILFVLDRSGSMNAIKNDTIGGFNSFLAGQKKLNARTTFTLAQFDDHDHPDGYHLVYDKVDVKEVPDLNENTFRPRGGTALLDAVGRTVNQYKNAPRGEALTILAILTDGEENASREYSHESIQALLKEVQDEHKWEVYFLGANINARAVGGTLGITGSNTMTFKGTGKGVTAAYAAVNLMASSSRGFVDSDLTELIGAKGSLRSADGTLDAQMIYNAVESGKIKPTVENKLDKKDKPDGAGDA